MKCKDVRKVAEVLERRYSDLFKQSRGSKREYYRGFMVACQAFQNLIKETRVNQEQKRTPIFGDRLAEYLDRQPEGEYADRTTPGETTANTHPDGSGIEIVSD